MHFFSGTEKTLKMESKRLLCLYIMVLKLASVLAIEPDCSNRESCRNTGNRDFLNRNCECDHACAVFGDCCQDAANVASIRRYRNVRSRSSCATLNDEPSIGAYMIERCSSSYRESSWIRRKCSNKQDISDPVLSTPVTSISSGITYRNRYCAECNSVSPLVLQTWSILLDCESLESFQLNDTFMWQNLKYKSSSNVWGVHYHGEFHTCDILHDIPSSLTPVVRLCRPDLVTTCPPHQNHRHIKRACESYMGVVYSMDVVYRNKYCALCNGITEDEYSCDGGNQFFRRANAYSFAILLDINTSQGEKVGMKEMCPDKEVYDPFFKKCRKIQCALPGFKLVNGKCQRN